MKFEAIGRLHAETDGDRIILMNAPVSDDPTHETFQPILRHDQYESFVQVLENLAREVSCVEIENRGHAMQAIMEVAFSVWVDDLQVRKGMEQDDAVFLAFDTFKKAVECSIDNGFAEHPVELPPLDDENGDRYDEPF